MSTFSLWSKILLLSAATLICANAAPQPGSVDPAFDPGRGPLGISASRGNSALIQPDGKILVTGDFNGVNLDFAAAVVRFNPDGSLDMSFNASALPAPTRFLSDDLAALLALQPNGQVLVAGKFSNSDGSTRYLTRLNADGSLDPSFNPQFTARYTPAIQHVVALNDGRMLLGGYFDSVNGIKRPGLARLNSDGTLDETFKPASSGDFARQSTGKVVVSGTNQVVRLNSDGSVDNTFTSPINPPSNSLSSLLIQPDDKLIWTTIQQSFIPEYGTTTQRLNAEGSNDPTFQPFYGVMDQPLLVERDGRIIFASGSRVNPDGSADSSFQPKAFGEFFAQQADGKLITVGSLYDRPYGIRRLFLDGSRDDSFAPEMGLTWIASSTIDRASLLPNGKIVIAGNFNYVGSVPRTRIALLNKDGTLDPGFDSGTLIGKRSDGSSSLNALATQADGKILVAMDRLVRINPDGAIDPSFQYSPSRSGTIGSTKIQPDGRILVNGPDGLVRIDSNGVLDPTFHAAQNGPVAFLQLDGKIMVSGGTRGLTRLLPDGTLDPTFSGIGGFVGFNYPYTAAGLPDGKVLVSRADSSNFRDIFVRLNSDGSNDATFVPNIASVSFIAIDQTGIYVGGNIAPQADVTVRQTKLGVVRLKFDGSRDDSFAPVEFNQGARLTNLLLQADGQLIVTGGFSQVKGVERHAIVRLNGSAPRKLANISTRAHVGRADAVEIGGFIVTGNAPKKVIVRAIGPSLASAGLIGSDILANPFLELHDAAGAVIAQNDDWRNSQEAEITASGIPPANNAESAIVATLAPGSYTAVIQGRNGGEGIALAEVYDLDPAADSRLANISTRGFVKGGDQVMIGGFILRGSENSTVIVRALGPSLASSGVTGALSDPTLAVYDQSGTIVALNDDWPDTQRRELQALGMGSASGHDSALIATLPPGSYTAIVSGAHDENGIALVEVYHLN
jgi:uncharacterized delta-60 repeat protein